MNMITSPKVRNGHSQYIGYSWKKNNKQNNEN